MSNRITETIKGSGGEITHYVLENGEIDGVIIAHSRKGEEYLRTKPDGTEGNNLSSLSNNQ